MDRTTSKVRNVQTNHEEFSYDYDGSAIPITKISKRGINKVNILNTTCRVSKDLNIAKKGIPMKKVPYNNCKT